MCYFRKMRGLFSHGVSKISDQTRGMDYRRTEFITKFIILSFQKCLEELSIVNVIDLFSAMALTFSQTKYLINRKSLFFRKDYSGDDKS